MNDTPLRRITREPALALGVVVAGLGLLVLFGVHLSKEQIGGIVTFLGAVVALLRFLLTPSSEVVVQQTPDGPVAGAAAEVATGAPVAVSVAPVARTKE
jgi:FtsH-binding integral membrane protein